MATCQLLQAPRARADAAGAADSSFSSILLPPLLQAKEEERARAQKNEENRVIQVL